LSRLKDFIKKKLNISLKEMLETIKKVPSIHSVDKGFVLKWADEDAR
jgi:hypothetical protein